MAELTVKANTTEEPVVQNGQDGFEQSAVVPAVDIFETGTDLVVLVDLPGVEKDGITVSTEKGVLTIKGVRNPEFDRDYNWREFDSSNYYRQFRLGDKIDATRIQAEFKHGVLRLVLPLADEVKPRQVQVKVT